jgi:hypothetical protein
MQSSKIHDTDQKILFAFVDSFGKLQTPAMSGADLYFENNCLFFKLADDKKQLLATWSSHAPRPEIKLYIVFSALQTHLQEMLQVYCKAKRVPASFAKTGISIQMENVKAY